MSRHVVRSLNLLSGRMGESAHSAVVSIHASSKARMSDPVCTTAISANVSLRSRHSAHDDTYAECQAYLCR